MNYWRIYFMDQIKSDIHFQRLKLNPRTPPSRPLLPPASCARTSASTPESGRSSASTAGRRSPLTPPTTATSGGPTPETSRPPATCAAPPFKRTWSSSITWRATKVRQCNLLFRPSWLLKGFPNFQEVKWIDKSSMYRFFCNYDRMFPLTSGLFLQKSWTAQVSRLLHTMVYRRIPCFRSQTSPRYRNTADRTFPSPV